MVYQIENIVFILKMKDGQQKLCLGKYSIDSDSDIKTFKSKIKDDYEYIEFYLLSKISDEKYYLLSENLNFDYNITLIEPEKEKTIDELFKEMRKYEPTGYPFESIDEDIFQNLYMKYIEKLYDNYCENNNYHEYQFEAFECFWEETSEQYHHKMITTSGFYNEEKYIQAIETRIIYDDGEDTQHNLESKTTVKLLNMKDDKEILEISDPKLQKLIDYLKNIYDF